MTFLELISPVRAWHDLRRFLATRKRHELFMLFPALALTVAVILAFQQDSHFEKAYERNIVYVESWPATRTDAQIQAQQRVDQIRRRRERAEFERRRRAVQDQFKRVDDKLESWGI